MSPLLLSDAGAGLAINTAHTDLHTGTRSPYDLFTPITYALDNGTRPILPILPKDATGSVGPNYSLYRPFRSFKTLE